MIDRIAGTVLQRRRLEERLAVRWMNLDMVVPVTRGRGRMLMGSNEKSKKT